ncbi:hypothetical protein DUI87_05873 [Hirundo rustica rustica]|uniref:Uncharacterized protein n=1 Tax=Hirundo rustica rustica TaxID=333673 RepID=A0A3M0KVG1_HIRRU|nr:hypothetical protein DUI87_05873 [Hirundo rustica rustica]
MCSGLSVGAGGMRSRPLYHVRMGVMSISHLNTRGVSFQRVPINIVTSILHMIDAYIFYMLAKQDEEIQPDLSGAGQNQASTLTDKCSGLVENRTFPEHWACLEMTLKSSHITGRQLNALKLKRDEIQYYQAQTGAVEYGKIVKVIPLTSIACIDILGVLIATIELTLEKSPPCISISLLITGILVSPYASSCGSMEITNGPDKNIGLHLCHVYKVHGGEEKSQRSQIMDLPACICIVVTLLGVSHMDGKKYPRPKMQVYGLQDRRRNTETASNQTGYGLKQEHSRCYQNIRKPLLMVNVVPHRLPKKAVKSPSLEIPKPS